IAIENVRLFTQLEAKNRDLSESLDQQTATAEILRVISQSPTDTQPVFDAIVGNAARLCNAVFTVVFRFDGEMLHIAALSDLSADEVEAYHRMWPAPPRRDTLMGRTLLDGRPLHVEDAMADPDYGAVGRGVPRVVPYRTVLAVPMLRDGVPIGVIGCGRREVQPFTSTEIALLQTFADQAVIAIENVRLFTEIQEKNRALTETLEQQTATGEILGVISSSPTNTQPVFDAIAESATRLLHGWSTVVLRLEGALLHMAASYGGPPGSADALRAMFPWPVARDIFIAQAIRDRTVRMVEDVERDESAALRDTARVRGWRANLAVPMLREGQPIGLISVSRVEPGPFAAREIELMKTFAEQAVSAIENVRLVRA